MLFVAVAALACGSVVAASALDPSAESVRLRSMDEYVVAVPPDATTQTVFAASCLARGIKAMCGVDVPVGNDRAGRKFASAVFTFYGDLLSQCIQVSSRCSI